MRLRRDGDPGHSSPADHLLIAALEAICKALVALQAARALAGSDRFPRAHIARAIEALRWAAVELRDARGHNQSPLSHGFITSSHDSWAEPDPDQSSP